MSDNPTQQTPDSRSFEERVFARFDTLDIRITTLEDKVDARLRDTRPIWEAMQADLANVKDDLASVKSEVKVISRNVMLLHEDNLRMRSDQRGLLERVEKLESQPRS
jgi:hypothetical protein